MIISKTVMVVLSGKNINHYESLGYIIPKYLDENNRQLIKQGTKIEVKVEDLPKKATVKVLCKCDKCGKERWLGFQSYRDICIICFNKNKDYEGKNNPHYNPNLTDEDRKYFRPGRDLWRKEVKERDDNTCQKCGSHDKIHAHHINCWADFKDERLDINNGITLCNICHIYLHHLYGQKTTKSDWEKFKCI